MTENNAKNKIRISVIEILLSALLAAGLLFVLFCIRGFYPFGNGSIALTDLYSQYLPLLYRFYDVVTGSKNLFMDPAIGGGMNAGLLAVKMLAVSDPKLLAELKEYNKGMKEAVEEKDRRLQEVGYKEY